MQAATEILGELGKSIPIQIDRNGPATVTVAKVHADCELLNNAYLTSASIYGRRTQIRISPEVWLKWRGRWRYKRLRSRHLTVTCADADQAELALRAIVTFCRELDGKWLAPAPEHVQVRTTSSHNSSAPPPATPLRVKTDGEG